MDRKFSFLSGDFMIDIFLWGILFAFVGMALFHIFFRNTSCAMCFYKKKCQKKRADDRKE